MKIKNGFSTSVVVTALCSALAVAQALPAREWRAAKYRGLTMGVSTKEEAIRAFGTPRTVGREQDTGIPTMTFGVSEPVKGTLVVYLKKAVVDGMTLLPRKQLTKSDVQRIFGPNSLLVRYATADCLTDGGSAPIYESPVGEIEHLEYRTQGVAAIIRGEVVQAIVYVSKPFGPTHSPCDVSSTHKPHGSQ